LDPPPQHQAEGSVGALGGGGAVCAGGAAAQGAELRREGGERAEAAAEALEAPAGGRGLHGGHCFDNSDPNPTQIR
jgi:hypothetical protein